MATSARPLSPSNSSCSSTSRNWWPTTLNCVLTMLAVAAGSLDEAAFAAWLRAHSRPR
jgi:hypothetical protein